MSDQVMTRAAADLEGWATWLRNLSIAAFVVTGALSMLLFAFKIYEWPATRVPITSATDLVLLFITGVTLAWLRRVTLAMADFLRRVE